MKPRRPAAAFSPKPDADEPVVGLRIIGGTMRGRKLQYSGDLRTRPMKDRVRESVFNLLGPGVKGSHALDLFAGTGALGIEAVSRGAAKATLIERHLPTTRLIEQNAAALGAGDKVEVVFGDTFLWVRRFLESARAPSSNPQPPWTVFCSPPYDFYDSRRDDMLALIGGLVAAAPADSLFAVEADERFDFALLPQPETWDIRTYLPAKVGIFRKS
jgi:16S rRNA (guanine966-N2)-methyltransferase